MSKVVFVGNVPYNMAEEQLIDVFKSVGQVVGFRLVFDRETGKPRGYGFCEFADHETAQSAVRNLNNVDVGGRPLRIDLADSDPFLEGKTTVRGELLDGDPRPHPHWRDRDRDDHRGKRGGGGAGGGGGGSDAFLTQLPKGMPVPPGSTALDMISTTLATMQPAQLVEVLAQMKAFVITHPDQARALLIAHPQFAYALFQALLLNKIVDQSVLQRMLQATTASAPAPPTGPAAGPPGAPLYGGPPGGMGRPPPPQAPAMPPYGQQPPMHGGPPPSMPSGMGAPPPNMYAQPPPTMPPPSIYGGYRPPPSGPQGMGMGMAPPPPGQAQPPPGASVPPTGPATGAMASIANMGMDPAQKQMLLQVLNLTPEQISSLQPSEREAIQALRNTYMSGIPP